MIQELEDVILECDLPEHDLRQGDIGTVVLIHRGHFTARVYTTHPPQALSHPPPGACRDRRLARGRRPFPRSTF